MFAGERVEQFSFTGETATRAAEAAIETRQGDPTYLGEVVLNEIDWHNRTASFRIALAGEKLFGQGYGSEVYDFNPRAQHVYEKMGFVREGVRRDVLLWDGVYHSAIGMSILEDEFKGLGKG